MSKRAEEFSIKYADNKLSIVDKELSETSYHRHTKMGIRIFDGSDIEEAAKNGYEQAEKDVWERIEKYLSKRDSSDFATIGWILKNIEEYKKEIMEDEE